MLFLNHGLRGPVLDTVIMPPAAVLPIGEDAFARRAEGLAASQVDCNPRGASMVMKVQGVERRVLHLWDFLRSARFWLAGPLVFITAVLVMSGGAVWMPKGVAGVDNIVMPLVLFPVFWAALFFYACLTARVARGFWVVGGIAALQVVVVTLHII